MMACAMLGGVQWQLGYPDQSRASLRHAVVQAKALEQPSSLVYRAWAEMVAGQSQAEGEHAGDGTTEPELWRAWRGWWRPGPPGRPQGPEQGTPA